MLELDLLQAKGYDSYTIRQNKRKSKVRIEKKCEAPHDYVIIDYTIFKRPNHLMGNHDVHYQRTQ